VCSSTDSNLAKSKSSSDRTGRDRFATTFTWEWERHDPEGDGEVDAGEELVLHSDLDRCLSSSEIVRNEKRKWWDSSCSLPCDSEPA